jgi:D-glycero-D-manno-heptose 1,7-bisphosphate phosphatase
VYDVPYNGDPSAVRAVPGVKEALDRLRARGIRTAVVSNQSGVARGLITKEQVQSVNRRIDDLLGPFDAWFYCPHCPDDRCTCRKPEPELILRAAQAMRLAPGACVVVGDKESDVEAARRAGARAILVAHPEDVAAAIDSLLTLSW